MEFKQSKYREEQVIGSGAQSQPGMAGEGAVQKKTSLKEFDYFQIMLTYFGRQRREVTYVVNPDENGENKYSNEREYFHLLPSLDSNEDK